MNLDYISFGANIRKYRKLAGLTQEKLAELVGCSNSHIGQIENGRGIPSLETTVAIANALGVLVDQLIKANSEKPELLYLNEIEDKIKNFPLSTRVLACQIVQDLLEVIEKSQRQ